MSLADSTWEPSRRELERRAVRRSRARRDILVASVAILVVIGGLVVGVTSSPGWPRVHQLFFNWGIAKDSFPQVIRGFGKNVVVFLVAEPCILVLGAGVAVVRWSRSPAMLPFRILAVVYADVIRGIPTILLVYLAGLGIPALELSGVTTNTLWLGTGALVLSYGAYVSEVFRAGIMSIHPSQVASADTLGLSRWQSMRFVILPQATRRVAPPLLNDFISLQKDTALLSVIFVFEAMFSAQDYNAFNFNYTSFVVAAVLFICLTIPLTRFTDWLGTRMMRREYAGVAR
ncbi:MAG: amino acid ABC transporter permease [Nocardioides sp.]